jgi:hypothetical protein
LLLLAVVAGCTREDSDRLARVGRKAAEKTKWLRCDLGTNLVPGWQGLRSNLDEAGLDARVACRLRWDRSLADLPIEVHAHGRVIELKGTVHDLNERCRAVELAESTLGVEKVKDLLEVTPR